MAECPGDFGHCLLKSAPGRHIERKSNWDKKLDMSLKISVLILWQIA